MHSVKKNQNLVGLWKPRGVGQKRAAFGSALSGFNGPRTELGAAVKGLAVLVLLVVVGVAIVAFLFGTVIPVGYVGVRKVAFGPGQGLHEAPLFPGYHWTIPGYSAIYQVPQTVQIIQFDRDVERVPNSFGAIDIPTVDGTTLDVDVSLVMRFFAQPGETGGIPHGGPADLINSVGSTDEQWRKYLSQVAENELKRSLSALSTVDFYNPDKRETQVRVAEEEMRKVFSPLGVGIDSVLLRRYTYRQEIDQAIFKKNLQELEISFNKTAGDFAVAQKEVNKVDSEGAVAIANLQKQGASEVDTIRSEGDLYRRQKQAEGDLLLAKARADVDKMRNEVLTNVGSDVYVALQLAQLLSSFKGGVVPNIDPYDFDKWVKKLSGAEPIPVLAAVPPTAAPVVVPFGGNSYE